MAKLKADEWQRLRGEYRTGLFSNCQLAEKYGVSESAIRKRARQEDWSKDLSQQVSAEINSRLQKYEVKSERCEAAKNRTFARTLDSDVVEAAAANGVAIIQRHRRSIDRAQRIAEALLERAEALVASGDELQPLQQVALLKELSIAARNWIALERQAYNLDAQSEGAPYEERLRKVLEAARE